MAIMPMLSLLLSTEKNSRSLSFSADLENEDPTCAAKYTIAVPSEVDVETAKFCCFLYLIRLNIIFMLPVINCIVST